jgi:N-acetylglucosaminyldiphosphoundecaprenol N-acetyl-beta-D-mannosaminyltransferase
VTLAQAVQLVQTAVSNRSRCFFSTPNLNFLVACQLDVSFRDSVIHSDLSLADGMPLIWMARWLRVPLPQRVAGSTLFDNLRRGANLAIKVYFFGGPEGAAQAACINLNATASAMRCVGYQSPGFGSVEDMSAVDAIERINASGSDFLVVALGAKKGNAWIEHNLDQLVVPIVSHLGAVVNFVAGSVSRAPVWMQRSGLEWVWRIREEPQLWRRYLADGVAFTRLLFKCVVPYAMFVRRNQPTAAVLLQATVHAVALADRVVLTLQGAWVGGNLLPLRQALSATTRTSSDVTLDFSGVTYVDSACMGILMLLYGHQQKIGNKLTFVGMRKSVQRIFEWNCVGFLLEQRCD